jgi:Na+-driven multidrug efflux pump
MTTNSLAAGAAEGRLANQRSYPVLDESRALLRLAVPIMLIALVNMGMSVTDTFMVSSAFGAEALAAVAVGSDFYSILFYLAAGTLGGLSPFYTAAVVRADPAARARLERTGQAIVLLFAAILVPVVWTAPDWLDRLGLDPDLLAEGRGYTRAMALTLVPMLGVILYRTLLTAAERPRVFLKVTAAMLPLNALGNHVFMHGFGPIPAFGPTGAGLSSLIVALASLGVLVLVMRRAVSVSSLPRPAEAIGWRDLRAVLLVGLPIGVATVTELGIFLGATLYAATLGAADVAAHTLTLRVAGVAYAVPAALAQAAMVRMARAVAVGDLSLRRSVTRGAWPLAPGRHRYLARACRGIDTAGHDVLPSDPGRSRRRGDGDRTAPAARRDGTRREPGRRGRRPSARPQGHPHADDLHARRLLGGRRPGGRVPVRGARPRDHGDLDRTGGWCDDDHAAHARPTCQGRCAA